MFLEINNLCLSFGGLKATNNVTMHMPAHEIHALIGPNGAGKTTFFNLVTGVYAPDSGEILFCGKPIQGLKPYQITKCGIARTYQVINLFKKMSVLENVIVGMHTNLHANFWMSLFHTKKERLEEQQAVERAYELLDFVGLKDNAQDEAGSLSYGQQRLLEIVRAMASEPKLLLLDEPAAGMNSAEKEDLDVLIRSIQKRGMTILLIEHDMKLVMGIADRIYVLNYGEKLAEGSPEEITNNPEVIKAYLGGEVL